MIIFKTNADLIRKKRSIISLEEIGVQVMKFRYTKKGQMLLEIWSKKETGTALFLSRLQENVGGEAMVRKPERMTSRLPF